MGTQESLERLCTPEFEVSSHYLISEQGKIYQLVDEVHRAWHAGSGNWRGLSDINSRSIGIELTNLGNTPYSLTQMASLIELMKEIIRKWGIAKENVIGHSDMAPTRKKDPGKKFDWRLLALEDLAVWPTEIDCSPVNWDLFTTSLCNFGYSIPLETLSVKNKLDLLKVFRNRFRPHHVGELDSIDMGIAKSLEKYSYSSD